jgi:hypothetical protein
MDVRQEIAKRVEVLPADLQERVLRFVTSLSAPSPGESGSALCRISSCLDPLSAREMTQAIEQECERVDASEW